MTAPYCPWVSITPLMTASILSMGVHSLINGSPHMSMGCPCLINQKSVLSIVLSSLINDFLGIYVHVSLMSCTASGASTEDVPHAPRPALLNTAKSVTHAVSEFMA